MWLALASFIAGGIAMGMLSTQHTDEVERDVPLERRPSWQFGFRPGPFAILRTHRGVFPESRLRWWLVAAVVWASVSLVTLLAAMNS